jgi:HEAT repeat protein
MEPVWGGSVDTAGPLRGTCAQALVACDIEPTALLTALTDHFVDTDKWVRVDIARAIAQLDRPESVLLLRLKALCGDSEPEVLGQCFASLLELAPDDSVAFVARFLDAKNEDVCLEAAAALALSRSLEALRAVIRFWDHAPSQAVRQAIAGALAGSPHPESAEFLLGVVRSHPDAIGCAAIGAMSASRFRNEFRSRLAEAVERAGSDRLERAFEEHFS